MKHQNLTPCKIQLKTGLLFPYQLVAQSVNLPVEHLIQCYHAGSPSSWVQPHASSCPPCWAPPRASCRPRTPHSPHRCAASQVSLPLGCWLWLAAFFNHFFFANLHFYAFVLGFGLHRSTAKPWLRALLHKCQKGLLSIR